MGKLDNKKVIITGGISGIGYAIATLFKEEGAKVIIIDIVDLRDVESTSIEGMHYFQCDVSKHQAMRKCSEKIFNQHGAPDILINNAGIAHVGNVERTFEEDFDRVYAVNVKGVYNSLFFFVKMMRKNGSGVILNMASVASHVGISDRFAYSMSKGAVLTMTYSIAKDYVDYNIRCNSISPARVHTPFVDGFIEKNYPGQEKEIFKELSATQPIGRMSTPEEVAKSALFLCSDDASFITGTDFPIDGGFIRLNT
ncbi:MAG: SDR family oxidoreductase [Cyclobacteriaceae bacterium]|nr:SDR family oxidoreductase [Cyclobacteriaceae bacterium]